MDREQAKEYVKNELEPYLKGKGIDTRKNFKCLICGGGDKTPPMSYKDNKIKCFSCGWNGDIFDLIGHEYNLTEPKDIFEKAYEVFGVDISMAHCSTIEEDFAPKEPLEQTKDIPICSLTKECRSYLKGRGFDDITIKRAGFGSSEDGRSIIIPYGDTGYYVSRSIEGKEYRYPKDMAKPLYHEESLYNAEKKPVFIVEGQFDAISIMALGYHAVALGGCGNRLLSLLKEKPTENMLILALDNDEAGERMTKETKRQLETIGTPFMIATITRDYKDANEVFQKDIDTFAIDLLEAAENAVAIQEMELHRIQEEYRKNSTKGHMESFLKAIKERQWQTGISTGFPALDEVLGGGFYEGLYGIGAISSLGKTTFAMQMGDYIAEHGNDVIVFSLEMSRYELMAKSISRGTFLAAGHLGLKAGNARHTRSILQYQIVGEEQQRIFDTALKQYQKIAEHHFIAEGVGNYGVKEIRKAVEQHYKKTGVYPVVFVDYLQILSPANSRSTDKQNTDIAVKELKQLSRDCGIPVVIISSLNRENYKVPISMTAFKESGAIEYSTDVLIGLELNGTGSKDFDVDAAKKKNPRDILLKVLKNRNGSTGESIAYSYIPAFNYFKETGKISK